MSDPWLPASPPPPDQPPPGYWPPASYGAPPGYGPPQSGYGSWYGGYGPPGKVRPTGTVLALFIFTLGIYGYVYNYKIHSEMKLHSGRGIGGGIALLLTFLANVAMPFVTPAEVGSLYSIRGQRAPVNGWTGLWVVGSAICGYIALIILVVGTLSVGSTSDQSNTGADIDVIVAFAVFGAIVITGGILWLVKTNGALNRYWESLGVS